ncbi:hypothetical protein BGZ65_005054, partial [Modicella reniformis]
MSLNPIASVIETKEDQLLLKILIDYCIRCAKLYHPAYLAPVEQCLAKLQDRHPDIVTDLFRLTSYILAHKHEYVASHAISASNRFQDIIDGNKYPVFILRSQLPTTTPSSFFFWNTNGDLHQGSESRFPSKQNEQPTNKKRNYKIYISPFQFKPINLWDPQTTDANHPPEGFHKISVFKRIAAKIQNVKPKYPPKRKHRAKRHHQESVFDHIAGNDYYDKPAIVAVIRFKWYTFVFKYWLARFVLVFMFSLLMMAITAKQISVSSLKKDQVPTADEIAARYLPGWHPAFLAVIPFGLVLLAYEVWQMIYSPKKYFWSQFNYVTLAAFISSIVGCFLFLITAPENKYNDTSIDGGPSQIWILGFSIILLYADTVGTSLT